MRTRSLHVETAIDSYNPRMPAAHWQPVAEFVRAAIRDTALDDHELVRRALIFTTQFVVWCVRVAGVPLTRDDIFDTSLVEEYMMARKAELSEREQVRRRALLLRVTEDLTGAPVPTARTRDSFVRRPYSREELAHFGSWANTQPSKRQRNNALAILTLGVGCGLTPEEVRHAHAAHIVTASGQLGINVPGTTPRFVPVLGDWADELRTLRDDNPGGYLFRTSGNRADSNALQEFIRSSRGIGPMPRPSLLRVTWIHAQLAACAPLNSLLTASGLTSTSSLTHYLPHLPASEDGHARLAAAKVGI